MPTPAPSSPCPPSGPRPIREEEEEEEEEDDDDEEEEEGELVAVEGGQAEEAEWAAAIQQLRENERTTCRAMQPMKAPRLEIANPQMRTEAPEEAAPWRFTPVERCAFAQVARGGGGTLGPCFPT